MRASESVQRTVMTAGVTRGTVSMMADEDIGTGYSALDEPTVDGEPVYWEPPNAGDGTVQYSRDATRRDVGYAPVLVDDPHGDPVYTHDWSYVLADRREAQAFIRFLQARGGRFRSVLYPTWSQDVVLASPVSAGDTTLTVEPIHWQRWYAGRNNRDRIALRTDAGWHVAQVAGSSVSGATETLALDRAVEAHVATDALVCWLERVRLAGDRVEIAWQTAGVAQATLQLRSVQ